MKKSYNPFKMWGSYVGAIVFGALLVFNNEFAQLILNPIYTIYYRPYMPMLVPFLIGFLIGWGIHSLFRRFK